MATDVTIGGEGELFADEDKTFRLEVVRADPSDPTNETLWVPEDVTGKSIVFDVRAKDDSPDPALLSKTASITGVFSSTSRLLNTQRAVVVVTDDEMHQFKGSNLPTNPKTYRHSWKITNSGNETVLSRGDFSPEKATAP